MPLVNLKMPGMIRKQIIAWVFISPLAILLVLLVAVPFFRILQFSVHEVKLPDFRLVFVGLDNFSEAFRQADFLKMILRSFIWLIGSVFFQTFFGLSVALIFNEEVRGKIVFRAITLLPFVIPGVVVAYTWKWLYSFDFGMINEILRMVGLGGLARGWLTDQKVALFAVMIANVWWLYPFSMIIFSGSLQTIPKELFEVAVIDGASVAQRFFYITLPWIKPMIVVITLLQAIWSLNTFTLIMVMTGGGPAKATDLFGMYIYREAFLYLRFEVAAAAAVFLILIMLAASVTYLRVTRVYED